MKGGSGIRSAVLLATLLTTTSAWSWSGSRLGGSSPIAADLSPDLGEFLGHVREHHPDLQRLDHRSRGRRGLIRQAATWDNPTLSFMNRDLTSQISPDRGQLRLLTVSQRVEIPTKRHRRIDRISSEEMVFRAESVAVVREVEEATVSLLAQHEALGRIRARIEDLLALVGAAEQIAVTRFEEASAPEFELLRVQVLSGRLESERSRVDLSRRNLLIRLGRMSGDRTLQVTDLPVVGKLASPPDPGVLQEILEAHPRVQAARAHLEQARRERRESEVAALPDPRLSLGYGENSLEQRDIFMTAIELPLPLLDRKKGDREFHHAEVEAAASQIDGVLFELEDAVLKETGHLATLNERRKLLEDSWIPKSRRSLELAQEGYGFGVASFLDLMSALESVVQGTEDLNRIDLEQTQVRVRLASLTHGRWKETP